MKTVCALIVVIASVALASLALAGSASAAVTIAGTGEPAYTSPYAGNTHWVDWQKRAGAYEYRLWATYYVDNVARWESFTPPTQAASGTEPFHWTGIAQIEHGKTYKVCVIGQYRAPGGEWQLDGVDTCLNPQGKRFSTTADGIGPTIQLTLAAGAMVRDSIPVHFFFQDSLAGPYPATFICIKPGDPLQTPRSVCEGNYVFSAGCSIPAHSGLRTSFECSLSPTNIPDGPAAVCVYATDSAVLNNSSDANQHLQADMANRSEPECRDITVDRAGPAVEVNASKTTARAGEDIAFTVAATDENSGVFTEETTWDFGDGTAASGPRPVHSFAKPGTYTVKARVRDGAGNGGVGERTITVEAPPEQKPDPEQKPGPEQQKPGPEQQKPEPVVPDPEPVVPDPEPVVPVVPEPVIDEKAITDAAGGGPLLRTELADLAVVAPKRFRLGKAKRLLVGVKTARAGRLTLRLVRGKRTIAQLAVGLSPGATVQGIRLPKGMKPGVHTLRILFKPAGAKFSLTGGRKIAFAKRR